MKPADPSNPHPAPSTGAAHPVDLAHPAQGRTTHLARKLGSLFKGVLSGKIQLSGDAGNDANSPLAVWKATHGHGGSKPVVPRLPPKPVPKPKAPVGKAGRKGKGALVAPRRPVIQVIERARPALVRGTAVGGKMVAVGGTAAAHSGIVVPRLRRSSIPTRGGPRTMSKTASGSSWVMSRCRASGRRCSRPSAASVIRTPPRARSWR